MMMMMLLSSSSITFVKGFFGSPGISTQYLFSPYYHQRPFSAPQPIRILFSSTTTMAEAHPQITQKKQYPSSENNKKQHHHQLISSSETKRRFCLSLILAIAAAFPTTPLSSLPSASALSTAMAADEEDPQQQQQPVLLLERYTDINEGFTLLRPSSWIKVEKAGATVLFEDNAKNKGTNNVGVVVSPVRLSSLGEFGSPQFVADKLIQAEKRKESTKDAQVIGVAERLGHGGLQVYEFEYKLDSTRGGMKRIFSAAFVASKKLYLLNIAYSDRPENPLDISTRMMLEQVLHSFDTAALL